jgi:hypothetical protein
LISLTLSIYPFAGSYRQAVAEIPWGHHLLILNKISDPMELKSNIPTVEEFEQEINRL